MICDQRPSLGPKDPVTVLNKEGKGITNIEILFNLSTYLCFSLPISSAALVLEITVGGRPVGQRLKLHH